MTKDQAHPCICFTLYRAQLLCETNVGVKLCIFTFTFISSGLHTFWHAILTKKRKYYIHPLTPALTLTLALTPTLNHLANEPLQTATLQYGLTDGSMTVFKFLFNRYRPNATSGGWSYGRDLLHCHEKGVTHFTSSH